MRWSETKEALSRRTRNRPLAWLIAALVLFEWTSFAFGLWATRHLPGIPMPLAFRPSEILFGFLGPLLLIWGSPMAWQWTGDDRPRPPIFRALAQGVALWLPWFLGRLAPGLPATRTMLEKTQISGLLPFSLGIGFGMGLSVFLLTGYAIASWERRVAARESALSRGREAQWSLLKGQMSPHVLLNSLGGLAELVREDPAAARKGMRDLAGVYRQLLEMGEKPLVPLASERRLLERYLAVEQLRLGEAMRVEWNWAADLDDLPVIPLLLQPLVENAIKHGLSRHSKGGSLRIEATRDAAGLRFRVENTGAPLAKAEQRPQGVGLQNLGARLRLAYGEQATLTLSAEDGWTRAAIHLPGSTPCR